MSWGQIGGSSSLCRILTKQGLRKMGKRHGQHLSRTQQVIHGLGVNKKKALNQLMGRIWVWVRKTTTSKPDTQNPHPNPMIQLSCGLGWWSPFSELQSAPRNQSIGIVINSTNTHVSGCHSPTVVTERSELPGQVEGVCPTCATRSSNHDGVNPKSRKEGRPNWRSQKSPKAGLWVRKWGS